MALRLYNTMAREKEEFAPCDPERVRMYVCGPTVYDRAHIGNARPLIVFDVLYRLLRRAYGASCVTYARNITDVDDKINARAAERNLSIKQLTEETTTAFHADVAALGCLPPDVEPRATDHIDEMKLMIEALVARGIGYVANGHVLFSVAAMNARGAPPYGALSRRSLDEMIAGARVEVAPFKREPTDFVLWKPAKPGEPSWPSPCGIAERGRPGWHIECSAMSFKHLVSAFAGRVVCEPALKQTFDIHGGGIDLVFPHHENEIAQSCCALDTQVMARVWMHNGFLQVEGEKMAKSAGNFVTINDLLRSKSFGGRMWSGDVLRLAMLRTHYRQPIDFTVRALEEAEVALEKWRQRIFAEGEIVEACGPDDDFVTFLSDDLNTPSAIARLHELLNDRVSPEGLSSSEQGREARKKAAACLKLIGIRLTSGRRDLTSFERSLLEARAHARSLKNWTESDRIRDQLAGLGVLLKDNKDGTTSWEAKQ